MTDELERDPRIAALFPLDERAGPARRISTNASEALVTSVLDAWQAGPAPAPAGDASGASTGGAAAPSGRGALVRRLAIGASTVALLGVLAAIVATRHVEERSARAPRPVVVSRPADVAVPPAPVIGASSAPEVSPAPEVRAPSRPDTRSTELRAPDDLLDRANGLRRSGRYAEAEATYRRVVELAPSSREAHVARVAAATIRLDRLNDPRGAARLFRAAMRSSSGALAAEAAFGLARASRAAGDRSGERRALEEVVNHHAGSPYAGLAARRLAELGGGGTAPTE